MKERILSKAAEDGALRARLIADPKAAVASEVDAAIPDSFDIVVHEDSATTAHPVLPPAPKLTEAEPETVAGAANWGPFHVPGS